MPAVTAQIQLPGRSEPLAVPEPGWAAGYPPPARTESLRRRPCGRIPLPRGGRRRRPRHRLGIDHAHPGPLVGARVRRGRGDGHLAARHGAVLGPGPGADRPDRGPQGLGGRCGRPGRAGPEGAGRRGGDRPARRRRGPHARGDHRRLRRAGVVRPVRGGAGDPDGQPRAGRPRPRPPGLPPGVRRTAEAGGPAGDPALAGRGVRPRAARLLGQHRLRRGRRDRARADRAGQRTGGRRQAVGARRAPGGGAAAPAAAWRCGFPPTSWAWWWTRITSGGTLG